MCNGPQIEQRDVRPVIGVIGFEHVFCHGIFRHQLQPFARCKITGSYILPGCILQTHLTQTGLVATVPSVDIADRPRGFPDFEQ